MIGKMLEVKEMDYVKTQKVKYCINGKEINEKQAEEILKRNKELMKSDNLSDWAKCEFVTVIRKYQ